MADFFLPFAEPLFWVTTWVLLVCLICMVIDAARERRKK